jgi:DNA-binding GntR family transcriptional regulator
MSRNLSSGHVVESQADVAYRSVYKLVLGGGAAENVVWFERQLGEQLGMGRTPVREALKRLQNEGLLIPVSTHGGLVAAHITNSEVEDIYRVRGALEALAAEIAARRSIAGELSRAQLVELERRANVISETARSGDLSDAGEANREFHEYISELADNTFLKEALDRLWSRISISALSNLVDDPIWISEIHEHHEQLVRSIVDGNPEVAASTASHHIQRAAEVYTAHHAG